MILEAVKEEEEEGEEGSESRPLVAATPQKLFNNGETDFHPPAVVLPGLQLPASPSLPPSPTPNTPSLSQGREDEVPILQPTLSGITLDHLTPPGITLDHPTPPGVTQDSSTSPGVTQDSSTTLGVTQVSSTPPWVTQVSSTPPGVTQDIPIPPVMPCDSGSDRLSPALPMDVAHSVSTSDEPQVPVCREKSAAPVVPAKAETSPPSPGTAQLPHVASPPSADLSATMSSSITERECSCYRGMFTHSKTH